MTTSSDRSTGHERRSNLRAIGTFLAIAGIVSLAPPAAAQATSSDKASDKSMCVDSYRNAQVQRKNGALKRSRELLLVCVSDKCPSVMQPDCTRWLTEVEAALPSVAFAAKGVDGKDVTTVRVTMDGQVLTEALDGKAIPVDPGSHTIRFEHAGEAPIEQTVVIREGEKARVVNVSWARPDETAAAGGAKARASSGPPATAWIVGGVGVGALAAFTALAVHGMSRRSDLEKECFGSCTQDQVDSVKTELMFADIALGVGVIAIGVSAVLFLTSGGSSESKSGKHDPPRPGTFSFGLAPQKNGGTAGLAARF